MEVHRILAARSRRESRRPEAVSLGAAFLLHTVLALIVLLLPRLQPPPKPLEFVPVTVIPAQALGVKRPAPARRKPAERPAEKPAPEPAAPEPEPEPERPREEVVPPPNPVDDDVPVLPREEPKKPQPKPEPKPAAPARPEAPKATDTGRKPTPAPRETAPSPTPPAAGPAGVAPGETGDQVGRRGAASGTPLGTTAFGSRIGVDNPDFTYGYYLDRLLSLIDAQWQRPNMGEVRAVIHFEIARDGSISDLRVAETSGYNAFDFAALRAVQSAAPFPPLPRGYRNESLGVNLIVQ
jgi:TonB family protein